MPATADLRVSVCNCRDPHLDAVLDLMRRGYSQHEASWQLLRPVDWTHRIPGPDLATRMDGGPWLGTAVLAALRENC